MSYKIGRTLSVERQRESLIAHLKAERLLTPEIEAAFRSVPREEFVADCYRYRAYEDSALPLQAGATVSQPSMLAIMLQEADLGPGISALEVGSGSGYLLALLVVLGVSATGVEIIPELARRSRETLERLRMPAEVIQGNAASVQFSHDFDRVIFSAAVREAPDWARRLLNPGGFVLAPVGDRDQQELVRAFDSYEERTGRLCRFVPFVEEWCPDASGPWFQEPL